MSTQYSKKPIYNLELVDAMLNDPKHPGNVHTPRKLSERAYTFRRISHLAYNGHGLYTIKAEVNNVGKYTVYEVLFTCYQSSIDNLKDIFNILNDVDYTANQVLKYLLGNTVRIPMLGVRGKNPDFCNPVWLEDYPKEYPIKGSTEKKIV